MAITLLEDIVNRFIVNSPADHTVEEYSGNTNVSAINSVLVYSRKENVKVFARVTATQVWQTLGVVGNDLDAVSGHGTEYRKDAVFNVTTMDRVSIISLGAETTARIVFNPSLPTEGLENAGGLTSMGGTMTSHILPDTNAVYDLGSAEKKIRHLFLSDNSLWIGDTHKVTISGGKMKFRKRKTTAVPAAVTAASGTESAALTHAGVATLADMKLTHWKDYMRTLAGQSAAEVKDIFRSNSEDYEDDFEAGASSGGSTSAQTAVTSMDQNQIETLTIASGTTPIVQIFEDVPPVAGSEIISYTGSDQSFVVPAGVTSLTAKLWGAAGGPSTGGPDGGTGASGGFASAGIAVTPGESLTIITGQGGPASSFGGGGGGLSAIKRGATWLVVAGAGGGGGRGPNAGGTYNSGAPGGGTTGGAAVGNGTPGAVNGGTQSSGGAGFGAGGAGSQGQGGSTPSASHPTSAAYGGGGIGSSDGTSWTAGGAGAGYFGGGAGGGNGISAAGGGGGSGYVSGPGVSNGILTAGVSTTPPNSSDPDYVSGVGAGSTGSGTGGQNTSGGNGLVTLAYSSGGATKALNKTSDYEIGHVGDTTVEVKKTSAGSANVKIRLI